MTSSRFKNIISYFPLRYYSAAIIFAIFLINGAESIKDAQEFAIISTLHVLNIPAFMSRGDLFVSEDSGPTRIDIPIYVQLLFLMLFPSLAFTARTNFASRIKLMSFGVLCFSAFIGVGLGSIAMSLGLGILNSALLFKAVSITASILIGCLVVELALFSTIRIPERTKIEPIIQRSYLKEYAFLALLIVIASIIVYVVSMFLYVDIDSPIVDYVHLYLWLNLSGIVTFGYFLSNFIFEAKRQGISKLKPKKSSEPLARSYADNRMPSVSFLIPAYNEERIAGRCIESIDKAAAKYDGVVEVIFINDGSTDGTERVVSEAIARLKHCSGRLFNIANAGKGYALVFGLEKTRGEIIFRTDADSIIDENALTPMMRHFKDPTVGSVCGWVFPIQDEGLWIKVQNVLCANYMYTKRAQDVLDSIITQPGSSTSFRRDTLIKVGGWKDNIFGEDGEITNRIARYGYREVFEPSATVYSEHPPTLVGLLQQRSRWGVAFYHSRGRNLRLVRELRNPRSLIFLWNIASHGGGLARSLIWPYLAASAISGVLSLSYITEGSPSSILLTKLIAIQLSIVVIQLALYGYRLRKVEKLKDLKYYPFLRLVNFILNAVVKPQVVDVMLYWTSRWKGYSDESFRDLRKIVNRSIDPLYPDGVPIISKKASETDQQQYPHQRMQELQKQLEQEQQEELRRKQFLPILHHESKEAKLKDDGNIDPSNPSKEHSTTPDPSKILPSHSSGTGAE
jgi:cellulose synthase/poly-beta-1,6-N-acetylglucosamine synthase-like glycosyltransferase